MRNIYLFFILFSSGLCLAQTDSTNKSASITSTDTTIYTIVEDMPVFPGGNPAMYKFIQKNMKFPLRGKDNTLAGSVYVTFVVEKDGHVSNVEALKTAFNCRECNEEAIRVVRSMPVWKPGKQNGDPVRVKFNLPIKIN